MLAVVAEAAEIALKTRLSSLGSRALPSAIPSLRSAPLIDIACGDSSLQSSGDISLRSAATPPFDLHSLLLALHLRGRQSVLSAVAKAVAAPQTAITGSPRTISIVAPRK